MKELLFNKEMILYRNAGIRKGGGMRDKFDPFLRPKVQISDDTMPGDSSIIIKMSLTQDASYTSTPLLCFY